LKLGASRGTLARNRGYRWSSLRAALKDYPVLLARLPGMDGPVDALPLGVATMAVLKDGEVVRQGGLTATMRRLAKTPMPNPAVTRE
jgi:hypothetical protein